MPEVNKPLKPFFKKDPDSRLDYSIDWRWADSKGRKYLATGESVQTFDSVTIFPTGGLSLVASSMSHNGSITTAFLEGGVVGERYYVTHKITTDSATSLSLGADRVDERTMVIDVAER